jgi:SH3 domain protein
MDSYEVIVKRISLVLLLLFGASALAETRYVSDELKINLRRGEGVGYKIVKTLPAGTPVEVMGTNPDNGYSQIRTREGTVGYVLTRQLMNQPSAKAQLARAEKERDRALEKAANALQLEKERNQARSQYQQMEKERDRLNSELEGIKRTASDSIRIAEERKSLKEQVANLTWELENLKLENRELQNDEAHDWFLMGAGVIIVGILIGLLLPRLSFRRRKKWGDSF